MWIIFVELLVEIGLIRADYKTVKRIEKINKENIEKGIKKKYVILPTAKILFASIGIIILISIIRIGIIMPKIRKAESYQEMIEIKQAIEAYYYELGRFPVDLGELIGNRPLRRTWGTDKWGNQYLFEQDSINKKFKLTSAGKDLLLNTEDDMIILSD